MRRGIFRGLAIACLAAAGCIGCPSQPAPKEPEVTIAIYKTAVFHGDTDFTPEERKVIEEALFRWRAQTDGLIQATVIWDLDFKSVSSLSDHIADNLIIRWTSETGIVRQFNEDHPRATLLGWSPGRIVPNPDGPARVHLVADELAKLSAEFFKPFASEGYLGVVMHEFGHVFGLQHVEDEDGLMHGGWLGGHACLSQEDISEFCRVNECGDVKPRPCNRWK